MRPSARGRRGTAAWSPSDLFEHSGANFHAQQDYFIHGQTRALSVYRGIAAISLSKGRGLQCVFDRTLKPCTFGGHSGEALEYARNPSSVSQISENDETFLVQLSRFHIALAQHGNISEIGHAARQARLVA